MREIKFRAWDKKEKIMCPVSVINFDKGCFLVGNSPTPEEWISDRWYVPEMKDGHFVLFKDLELMQRTSRVDVNKKESYEGDIIKWFYADYSEPCIHSIAVASDLPEEDFEVIGNIYENSELLESFNQNKVKLCE